MKDRIELDFDCFLHSGNLPQVIEIAKTSKRHIPCWNELKELEGFDMLCITSAELIYKAINNLSEEGAEITLESLSSQFDTMKAAKKSAAEGAKKEEEKLQARTEEVFLKTGHKIEYRDLVEITEMVRDEIYIDYLSISKDQDDAWGWITKDGRKERLTFGKKEFFTPNGLYSAFKLLGKQHRDRELYTPENLNKCIVKLRDEAEHSKKENRKTATNKTIGWSLAIAGSAMIIAILPSCQPSKSTFVTNCINSGKPAGYCESLEDKNKEFSKELNKVVK